MTLYLFYIRKVFLEGTPKSSTAFFTVHVRQLMKIEDRGRDVDCRGETEHFSSKTPDSQLGFCKKNKKLKIS